MYFDSDGLVHKGLVVVCQEFPSHNRWYMEKGYEYSEGTFSVYLFKKDFYSKYGSSSILKYQLCAVLGNGKIFPIDSV